LRIAGNVPESLRPDDVSVGYSAAVFRNAAKKRERLKL
jgi:hypothetical protein